MILIDSNIFMYAAGKPHTAKAPSTTIVRRIARGEIDATIDAEVLQEILHRYWALRRISDGQRVYELARHLVPAVLPITADLTDQARDLLIAHPSVSARDALHAAVIRLHGLAGICSFDTDFDRIPGLTRLRPEQLAQMP